MTLEVYVEVFNQFGKAPPDLVKITTLQELYEVCIKLDPSVYTCVQFVNHDEVNSEDRYMSLTLDD